MSSQDEAKRAAAQAAVAELPDEGVIGLGTGSTTRFFIEEVGRLVRAGKRFVGVPTSEASRAQAQALGIPLLPDEGPWRVDVTVDGADEVSAALDLIKGGGGALTREKIVNASSAKNVIIVDESKLSAHLGERFQLPIEVVAFGHRSTAAHLAAFGTPVLRTRDGAPVRTDAGNVLYDVATGPIDEPEKLEAALQRIPGVLEVGLFVRRTDVLLIAGPAGVRRVVR